MDVGSYLRVARERRHLTVEEISRRTKIHSELLVGIENSDLSRWPKHRIYRHSHLRSYAEALGLDPKPVLKQFDEEFGDPFPAAFHGRPRNIFLQPLPQAVRSGLLPASLVIFVGGSLAVFDVSRNQLTATEPAATPIQTYRVASVQPAPEPVVAVSDSPEVIATDIEGELQIVSRPAGAHVTVNGIARGQTPLRVRYLPLGSYTVRVIQPGYKIGETVVALRPEQPNRTVRVVLRDAPVFARTSFSAPMSPSQ
jgi:transcriptional regulator with XRE-family HTH domain